MTIRKQTKIWKTRDGRKVRICDMTDEHLMNTIKYLERFGAIEHRNALQASWFVVDMVNGDVDIVNGDVDIVNGEYASYCVEQEADRISEMDYLDFVPDIYWNMIEDAQRRGIKK